MPRTDDLTNARLVQADEFYTSLTDIEKELKYYKKFFRDKIVYCNCDTLNSNFFKYFSLKFENLGLKQLIITSYNPNGKGVKCVYNGDLNGNQIVDEDEVEVTEMESDGDFRSDECIEIMKQSDVVVTNPPFSLFREFILTLNSYDKKFLVIGNVNAITYKDIFPLVMENKLWLGVSIHSGDREFQVPDSYPLNAAGCRVDENGNKFIRVKGVRWFTNIDNKNRHEELELYKRYTPDEYPTFDNYDAINVNETALIPEDYYGVMGVPITFIDRYCPDQFEIIGNEYILNIPKGRGYVNGKRLYSRIFIKRIQQS